MEVNFLAVGLAALAGWAAGALWYSPVLFSKAWQSELGFTDEYIKEGNMALIFGTSFLIMCLMAFGLTFVINAHGDAMTWTHGAFHGAMTGIFFVGAGMAINYLYQRRSMKLYLIDAGYQILMVAIMGAVLGAFA